MPFWGLVFTSVGFCFPAWVALRKRKLQQAKLFGMLSITSTLYHGTRHVVFHIIDKVYVHVLAIGLTSHAIWKAFSDRSIHKTLLTTTSIIPVWLYFGKSAPTPGPESAYWHMLFHLASQGCFTLHAQYF